MELTMSIQSILFQLETTFGKPLLKIMFNYNIAFTLSFSPMDTPETLFHRIEDAVLGGAPYSVEQIAGNTMFLFLQSGIFPTREFEAWDAIPNKTWPALKTFVRSSHRAYVTRQGKWGMHQITTPFTRWKQQMIRVWTPR
jgi:hypothetical protein